MGPAGLKKKHMKRIKEEIKEETVSPGTASKKENGCCSKVEGLSWGN